MSKKTIQMAELQERINKRIASGNELDGDCQGVRVSIFRLAELDEIGCNWYLQMIHNGSGCVDVIDAIVSDFKKKTM